MATLTLDWTTIQASDEYQSDLTLLKDLVVNALGIEDIVDQANPFVYMCANLVATHRYFVRHLPEVKDLDLTPFLNYMQKEIGFDLPLTSNFPTLEFLRESKSWYGHKGAISIFAFIGSLVGSPIEVDAPAKLIFKLDSSRSYLSGKSTHLGGERPFNDSNLARIRDGIYWSQFTYLVDVLQAQNIVNTTDLINLLNNVHPAGTKMFIKFRFNYITPQQTVTLLSFKEKVTDSFFLRMPWPSLDNNLILDDRNSALSMHFGKDF